VRYARGPTPHNIDSSTADHHLEDLDVRLLPSIVHIDCSDFGTGPALNIMLASLPTDNCITSIHLSGVSEVMGYAQWATITSDFEAVVLQRLRALRQISFDIWQISLLPERLSELTLAVEAALPRLHARGLLSVSVYDDAIV
jgi:hypothetical protein